MTRDLDRLLCDIRACRFCRDETALKPMEIEPRPVVRARRTARLLIAGQAPGARVHASGIPFDDPSGDRLRAWMGVTREEFYNEDAVAFAPMGFCFPGHDAKGGDLPPRRECAGRWRTQLIDALPNLELVLIVGSYAQAWHLGRERATTLSETVRGFRRALDRPGAVRSFPLPHPSWRNTGWIKANPWFKDEVLPVLRAEVRTVLGPE